MQTDKSYKASTITLSMIVKNEEKYLQGCLDSVKSVVSEIVIVDTGSIDSTIEIAKKFGAKIYHFDWVNDFSAARNYSLQKSSGKWILYLDADERLSANSVSEIKRIVQNNNKLGVFCTVKSLGGVLGSPSVMKYTRLFRNLPKLKFTGKVHEQIDNSLKENDCSLVDSGIEIIHLGYDVEHGKIKEKAERNLKLLESEYKINPSGYSAFQLGQTLNILGEINKANKYFKVAVDDLSLELHHRAQAYRQLAAFELKNKQYNQAETLATKGLNLVPESPLLNIVKANILLEIGKGNEAVEYCKVAYKNNHDFLTGKKASQFELTVNEKNILLYGINLSIAAANVGSFKYFYSKVQKHPIENDDNQIIRFYKKILFNESIDLKEIKNVLSFSSKIDYNVLVKNLLSYNILESKLNIIEISFRKNTNNRQLQDAIYSILISDNSKNSVVYLEKAYELNPQDLQVGFILLNKYIGANQTKKLLQFVDKAVKSYSAHPNIVEKFENIREKFIRLQK